MSKGRAPKDAWQYYQDWCCRSHREVSSQRASKRAIREAVSPNRAHSERVVNAVGGKLPTIPFARSFVVDYAPEVAERVDGEFRRQCDRDPRTRSSQTERNNHLSLDAAADQIVADTPESFDGRERDISEPRCGSIRKSPPPPGSSKRASQ